MKTPTILLGLLTALFFINSQQTSAAATKKDCPLKKVTNAYFDHREPIVQSSDVGKIYKSYMESVKALKKTGNFKNFKLISQSLDFQPIYNNTAITTVLMRVSIEFDLNYDAISDLFTKLKKSGINISTHEVKSCD